MDGLILWGRLLPLLTLAAIFGYGRFFIVPNARRRAATPVLVLAALVHAAYLGTLGFTFGRIPLASLGEAFSAIALAMMIVYLWLELTTRGAASVGIVVLPIVLGLQSLAGFLFRPDPSIHPILETPWFGVHAGLAILACAAFTISAVFGICHLVLYRQIRSGRFGRFSDGLPALEALGTLNFRGAVTGWVLMTVAMMTGMAWASGRFEGVWLDPKVVGTGLTWAVYGVVIGDRLLGGTRGRRIAWVSLAGFCCLLLAVVAGSMGSFHDF